MINADNHKFFFFIQRSGILKGRLKQKREEKFKQIPTEVTNYLLLKRLNKYYYLYVFYLLIY